VAHDDFADAFPKATPCRVIIGYGDGPQSLTVLHALGDVANPMSSAQVIDKFRRIGAASVAPDWQETIVTALHRLAEDGLGPLLAALGAPLPRLRLISTGENAS
jgi:2-methylcitrate dehydratase PrpD